MTTTRRKPADKASPRPRANRSARWADADEFRWAIRDWSVKIGVRTPSVHFRPMTTKWASISTRGRMTVDTSLLRLSRDLGEFVIVHELVHLLAPNHGKLFKSFMTAYLPDWQRLASQLARSAHLNEAREHTRSSNL